MRCSPLPQDSTPGRVPPAPSTPPRSPGLSPNYHAGGPAGLVAGSPRPRHRSPGRVRRPVSTPARLPQRGLAEFSVGEAHQAAAVTAGPAYGSHLRGAGGRRGRAGAAAGAWGCGGVPAAAGAERRKAERSPSPDGRGDGATRWGACAGHARSMRSAPRRPSRAARLRRGGGGSAEGRSGLMSGPASPETGAGGTSKTSRPKLTAGP